MDRYYYFVLAVLICVIQFSTASESVLDLPNCEKVYKTENVYISPYNTQITKKSKARTDIECLLGCKDAATGCNTVYKDKEGNCYEFDTDSSLVTRTGKDLGIPSGNLLQVRSLGDSSSCSGVACDTGEICLKKCGSTDLSPNVCLADERGKCDIGQEYSNARHYWSTTISDGRDSGTVMFVTYPKARSITGLRVIIHMNVRGHHNSPNYCHHWYLTFDNNKCTNPQHIEQLDYSATTGDLHRAMDIDGTCYGLAAGNIRIDLVIGPCDGYGSTDGHSGWNSARTMVIMEVIPKRETVAVDAEKNCPSAAVFNYQYESWNEEIDVTYDSTTGNRLIKEVTYVKLASDTGLRIKYNALMSLKIINSGLYYCGRWFIAIDGNECSPLADVVIHQSSPDHYTYWRHHTRVRTLEGICTNTLSAGTHAVQIYFGNCYNKYSQPTNFVSGGFNSPSRLIIEEVRLQHKSDGVIGIGNKMFRSLTAYLQHWQWENENNGEDNAVIFTLTYVKQHSATGLRLTSSGDHRTIVHGSYSQCGRWYFTIDNSHCSNPGVIEGVSYFQYYTNVHHPMQVSGICHGIGAGTRTIRYGITTCSGYNPTEAYTGWGSSFHIFAEEMRFDLVKTCSGNPVNCGGP